MKDSASTPNETGQKPAKSPKPTPRHYRPYLWRAYKQLLATSSRPILVGPWTSELGFEALYWLPFLQRFRDEYQIDPARLIPITRGGAAVWYNVPGGFELYAMRTPQDVRIAQRIQHAKTGLLKQTAVTAFDKAIYRDAAETLKLKRYHTLHPAWLYQTLAPFWDGARGLSWVQHHLTFGPVQVPALPETLRLPEKFVAVRFYARSTFPMAPQLAQFATETITQIAQQYPVIILNNKLHLDDHVDFAPANHPNVARLSDLVPLTPENNLAIQSAVIARAVGFVGTYGGLAQFALRCGKPVISLYHEWVGTALPHKHLSEALALQMGKPFLVLRLGDLPLIQSQLPQMVTKLQDVADQVPSALVSV